MAWILFCVIFVARDVYGNFILAYLVMIILVRRCRLK